MVGGSRFSRALVGVAGLAAGLAVSLSPVPAAHADGTTPVRPADDAPLKVVIDDLAPSYLPTTGDITVRGTVTNRDTETWTNIRLYAFAGDRLAPMRNPAQLAAAAATPYNAVVGDRITSLGTPGSIATLAPGATATFTVTVPASAVDVHRAGVYWFGVHALGVSAGTPDDQLADGRARTFLPFVPRRITGTLPAALVMPLDRDLPYADDGSLDDLPSWARTLSPGGRLYDAVDFATGATPVTWLVDPALVDAVGRLARGNPPRSLDPTGATTGSGSGSGSGASEPAHPTTSAGQSDPATSPVDDLTVRTASQATTWLAKLASATSGDQVLALPYGNLDVPAALRHDPSLAATASALTGTELAALHISTSPALTSPGGYVDAATIAAATGGTTVLASDRLFPRHAPGVATVDGHRVVVTSTGAASGGPGPGPAITALGLRQRILSEAAVRLIKDPRRPLTVVLPTQWGLDDPGTFFGGLHVPWLDLESVQQLAAPADAPAVAPGDLDYPALQRRRQLDASTFRFVGRLIASGDTLGSVLTRRSDVDDEITRQALAGASYSERSQQQVARERLGQARSWVTDKLDSIGITAPKGVTLSSASGKFAATLTNRLDEAVTVGVKAVSDRGIDITPATSVEIGPHSHTTVILEARASTNKVHNVTLKVTDARGRPLGATDELPIRSAQVSQVIWLIMGTGAGLLFGAIIVRLVRRFRRSRRPVATT